MISNSKQFFGIYCMDYFFRQFIGQFFRPSKSGNFGIIAKVNPNNLRPAKEKKKLHEKLKSGHIPEFLRCITRKNFIKWKRTIPTGKSVVALFLLQIFEYSGFKIFIEKHES